MIIIFVCNFLRIPIIFGEFAKICFDYTHYYLLVGAIFEKPAMFFSQCHIESYPLSSDISPLPPATTKTPLLNITTYIISRESSNVIIQYYLIIPVFAFLSNYCYTHITKSTKKLLFNSTCIKSSMCDLLKIEKTPQY